MHIFKEILNLKQIIVGTPCMCKNLNSIIERNKTVGVNNGNVEKLPFRL